VASSVPKSKRNQYPKGGGRGGRKSTRKKTQANEEGRRILSEGAEENSGKKIHFFAARFDLFPFYPWHP
jgi:hypothetical protein